MSQVTGAGFASGAIGAGVNEAIIGEIKKIKDPGTAQIVSAIVGAAAAKAVGGKCGFWCKCGGERDEVELSS